MPFPLAHPAAVLPLRRFAGRWINLVALIIGSVVPDSAYLLGPFRLDHVSHTAAGVFLYSLPAGLLLVALTYSVYTGARRIFPGGVLPSWIPELPRAGSFAGLVVSVCLGACTHVLWDSFTHKDGWFVQRSELLQTVLFHLEHRPVRVCHALWYLCSFLGIAYVYFAYARRKAPALLENRTGAWMAARDAFLFAAVVLPIELLHHLSRAWWSNLLVALLTLTVVAVLFWRLARGESRPELPDKAAQYSRGVR